MWNTISISYHFLTPVHLCCHLLFVYIVKYTFLCYLAQQHSSAYCFIQLLFKSMISRQLYCSLWLPCNYSSTLIVFSYKFRLLFGVICFSLTAFSISCKASQPPTNSSIHFRSSESVFISSLPLKYSFLDTRFLFDSVSYFWHIDYVILLLSGLYCVWWEVSFKLIGVPLFVISYFSLTTFLDFLVFDIQHFHFQMHLVVGLFVFILLRVGMSFEDVLIVFHQILKHSWYISLQICFYTFLLVLPLHMSVCLMISHISLRHCSFSFTYFLLAALQIT